MLATDGEERVPMEGRHFNVVKSFVCLLGTASSSQGLEVQDHSAALDRNKFFFHPPIPGCYWLLWLSVGLGNGLFSTDVLHSSWMYRNSLPGEHTSNGGRPGVGQHRGELCSCTRGVRGSFAMRPGPLPERPSDYSVR